MKAKIPNARDLNIGYTASAKTICPTYFTSFQDVISLKRPQTSIELRVGHNYKWEVCKLIFAEGLSRQGVRDELSCYSQLLHTVHSAPEV